MSRHSPVDPPEWLRALPVAPEYRPTPEEFADPIAFILKIEQEACRYGICKIVPPLPAPPREATVQRLNASFAANAATADADSSAPTFPTRLQQVGLSTKNRRGANRRVWESGERYTLEAFRSRSRDYELPRHATPPRQATPLQLEALFWGACASRPFNVEYANDMPGSGFAVPEEEQRNEGEAPRDVGETDWNMRVAPRAPGSLLRAMSREVAGVTTPMLYVAMLYSWFAWHVEDHELHSLNYLHFGKPKSWYGVPRDAMLAFEDTVRVQGYADDLNAIMAFQTLNQKTTVLSPQVLLSAGVPCCRLVQNPGEFVITFPGAYHSGFSHGFNCGEATNIATPRWLQVAKEAAIRRASTNCCPMMSHHQLLYKLALSLRHREPKNFHTVPRSSRLREKKKMDEADIMLKEKFVGSVIENNSLLSILLDKSSCIIVPEITFPLPSFSMLMKPEVTVQSLTSDPCSISRQVVKDISVDVALQKRSTGMTNMNGSQSVTEASFSACNSRKIYETKYGEFDTAALCVATSEIQSKISDKDQSHQRGGLLDQGRLPCVQCGILSFACVAIIQPREAAIQFVMSSEGMPSSTEHGEINKSDYSSNWIAETHELVPQQGKVSGTIDDKICSINLVQVSDRCRQLNSSNSNRGTSALGLLASAYESSDSEEEKDDNVSTNSEKNDAPNHGTDTGLLASPVNCSSNIQGPIINLHLNEGCEARILASSVKPIEQNCRPVIQSSRDTDTSYGQCSVYHNLVDDLAKSGANISSDTSVTMLKNNKDYCRMHVFCLEHALETWTQLQQVGGANVMLLCHSEYPKAESAAKFIAKELGLEHDWKDITFEEATEQDVRRIQLALQDEDAEPASSDWAVKMGINIYYSAKQSKSPLYSKQIPYNSIIYKAFGQENLEDATDHGGKRSGISKKRVAGSWCGRVWMISQVHPILARESEEQNHGSSKAMLTANSHEKLQDQSLINRIPSKRRERGESIKKSRAKKRCPASDEASLHCISTGMDSEEICDQPGKFEDHSRYEGDGIENAPSTKKRDTGRKSRSKRQKDDKRNINFHEVYGEDNDLDCLLDVDTGDDAMIINWDTIPLEGLDAGKEKSPSKLQGSKKKSSKGKASDESLKGDKKLLKIKKKSISRNPKTARENRQFQEDHDDTMGNLLSRESRSETSLDNWDKFAEEKSDNLRVESRGKKQNGKDDERNSSFFEHYDEDTDVDCWLNIDSDDNAMIGSLDDSPEQRLDAMDVKSDVKLQWCNRKSNKSKANDDLSNGDKKSQKVSKKSSSKKQKNSTASGQSQEDHHKDNTVDHLLNTEVENEATLADWEVNDDLSNGDKKSQKVSKKSSSKKQKNGTASRQSREGHHKDNTVEYLHTEVENEATLADWEANDDLSNGDKKSQKASKKSSSKKQKNSTSSRQSREGHHKDNTVEFLLNREVENEATLADWDAVPEEQADDVRGKSRGKVQSGKIRNSKRKVGDGLRSAEKLAKFPCDIDGCDMSFSTQQDLLLHKRDICPVKGCKKKFFCHKYLLQHRKVHIDDRPLKCAWKGCKKTFKWPWARTEHMRVHTGVRPYECKEPGCTQTFRFVSDFSRHKRKTGHSCDKRNKDST